MNSIEIRARVKVRARVNIFLKGYKYIHIYNTFEQKNQMKTLKKQSFFKEN